MSSLYEACNFILDSGNQTYQIGNDDITIEAFYEEESISINANRSYGSSSHHNIVLLKAKEINIASGVTVTTAYPKKSLVLFCEKLVNNGTISMTGKGPNTTPHDYHIAYTSDKIFTQDVIIPAYANNAAPGYTSPVSERAGTNGKNGTNRQCGSGGTGSIVWNNSGGSKCVGASGMGYAFGGGAGSGGETGTGSSAVHNVSTSMPMVGGTGYSYTYYAATGGVGQPCGENSPLRTYWDYAGGKYIYNQNVGVGGRIIIFCNEFINNGKIEANGIDAVFCYVWGGASGGASGGGAVDIFYHTYTGEGTVTANGGTGTYINGHAAHKSGNGGNGSVTLAYIDPLFVGIIEEEEVEREPVLVGIQSLRNSNIYKTPEEFHIFDLTQIGTIREIENLEITQENHYFQIGDVIYYNPIEKKFLLAVANNSIESEVAGVVSEIIDVNTFKIKNSGLLQTDRYSFDVDTPLYLSGATPGKLTSIAPVVIKQIATQSNNGIIIDIKRGWILRDEMEVTEYEPYTKEELDEIISNMW